MKVVFMGTPDFAVPTLLAINKAGMEVKLVITQPDRKSGRGKKVQSPQVKIAADDLNLKVVQPNAISDDETYELLKNINPDVIVVVAYGQIIPEKILELPRYGCLNVHASLLPKYRGAAPIHFAIINGENETGVTIMEMEKGLDTGDMLKKGSIKIEINDNLGDIHDKLAVLGAELLIETLVAIPDGIKKERQEDSLATYAPKTDRQLEKIDWTKPVSNVHNLIRGLNPWPGAYTKLAGENIKIWQSEIVDYDCLEKQPGYIIKIDPLTGIEVQTGKGVLRITELQLAGKKRMKTTDFLKGRQWDDGLSFDS